jgi:ATP-dependent RNA helicase DDX43
LSPSQVKEFREENNQIKVYNFNSDSKDPLLNPVCTFNQAFEPYPEILNTIKQQGFDRPSPIQAQAWPYLLSGKVDIIINQIYEALILYTT